MKNSIHKVLSRLLNAARIERDEVTIETDDLRALLRAAEVDRHVALAAYELIEALGWDGDKATMKAYPEYAKLQQTLRVSYDAVEVRVPCGGSVMPCHFANAVNGGPILCSVHSRLTTVDRASHIQRMRDA